MANKICVRCGMEYPNHKMSCKIPVEEWRLPTAEEWLLNHKELSIYHVEEYDEGGYLGVNEEALYRIMVEFAKLHCETQLKAILENAKTKTEEDYLPRQGEYVYTQVIDKDSILNAYPLDLIR
jgi:hypothetical protein